MPMTVLIWQEEICGALKLPSRGIVSRKEDNNREAMYSPQYLYLPPPLLASNTCRNWLFMTALMAEVSASSRAVDDRRLSSKLRLISDR